MLGNVLYINCLDRAAVLADVMGDTDKAESYRETAATAREAWNEFFIDPDTGKTKRTLRARFKIHRLLMQLLFVSMW